MGAIRPIGACSAPLLSPASYRVPVESDGLLRLAQEAFAVSTISLCALAWRTGIPPASLSRLLRRVGDPGLTALERALVAAGQVLWCVGPQGSWFPILNADGTSSGDGEVVHGEGAVEPLAVLAAACRCRGIGARALAHAAGIAVGPAHRLLTGVVPRGWGSVGGVLAALGYRLVVVSAAGDALGLMLPAVRGDDGERSHRAHLAALDRYRSQAIAMSDHRRRGRLLIAPERLVRLAAEGVRPRALAAMAGVGMARLRQVLAAQGVTARTVAIGRRAAGNQPRLIAGAEHQ
jgi:hypothetical protein